VELRTTNYEPTNYEPYNAAVPATALLVVSLAMASQAQEREAAPAQVVAEFRIFSGTDEITPATRLRIMPTGTRDRSTIVPEGSPPLVEVPSGIYDVQAFRLRQGSIVGIRWAERLVLMYYPDEGGRHLEVINFEPGYGALQVRAARGTSEDYDIEIFPVGDRSTPVGAPLAGDGYRLFVVPAGRYDIRVRPAGSVNDAAETRWFLDVEVPADRTRLKVIG
jgi:hypothetical protein